MSTALLEVKELQKFFPVTAGVFKRKVGDVKAVDGINFTLNQGEVVGLVGESGSGKSTAARVALSLYKPTGGQVLWMGKDLSTLSRKELLSFRREAQIVFQDPYASLNPRRPVVDSIGEGLVFHGLVKSEEEKRERVAKVLNLVGLQPDTMDRYPHQFSGGQQQRICIGRAIAMDPKLIICDESLSALDVSVQAQILNLLADLKERLNLSYLFISHDLSTVRFLCDRVVVLYLGKVMEEATTEELFSNPKHPYTQALLSATPRDHPEEKVKRIILKGEIPSPIHPPSGCPFRTRCPYVQAICSEQIEKKELHGDHNYYCIL